jgi:hypothetical protein
MMLFFKTTKVVALRDFIFISLQDAGAVIFKKNQDMRTCFIGSLEILASVVSVKRSNGTGLQEVIYTALRRHKGVCSASQKTQSRMFGKKDCWYRRGSCYSF